MKTKKIIGVDFGATNIRGGIVFDSKLSSLQSIAINRSGSIDDVLKDLFYITDQLFEKDITAIGIGVPSVVDIDNGIVYDVQYIPSWKEVHLKKIMEDRYQVPVIINNDANCFSTGEFYFGKGIGSNHMIGLTIGTGLGAGLIINKKYILTFKVSILVRTVYKSFLKKDLLLYIFSR
jgi:glucokinase